MKRKFLVFFVLIIFIAPIFISGCTHEMVSLYLYKLPNKLVYEIGEELSTEGIKLKNIKTDSALLKVWLNDANFEGFDSTTSGKKTITITYGKFSTSFDVFVANKVVTPADNLTEILETASDGDIILIKAGEYNLTKPIEINSSIVVGGEGADKTKINSMIIVGGYYQDNKINYIESDLKNLSIISLGLTTTSKVKDSIIEFESEFMNSTYGAINAKNANGLNVIGCNFTGFCYGLKSETMFNAKIINNNFKKLFVGGILVEKNITNSLISKNVLQNIGGSVVNLNEDNTQGNVFGIKLSFNQTENVGVTLFKNSISKIGLNNGSFKFLKEKTNGNFANSTYMFNSAAIIVRSSAENNLNTVGICIVNNSIGATLNNVLYNTNNKDNINSSSITFLAP